MTICTIADIIFHFFIYSFCVGDRFYLFEDKILCEDDYNNISRHRPLDLPPHSAYGNCIKKLEPPPPSSRDAGQHPHLSHPLPTTPPRPY